MKKIAKKFNRSAEHCYGLATSKGFLSFAFAAGIAALPFNQTIAAYCLAAPTIYAGFGLVQNGIANTIDYFSPSGA